MPRKSDAHAGWARIAASAFIVARAQTPAFSGIISLYTIAEVREPLIKRVCGELTVIADNGFRWLQLYSDHPERQTYTVTAAYTANDVIAQWYIDVSAGHGVDHTGVPWHDDLYLDLVANGLGAVEIIDAADLEAALAAGEIEPAAYHLAWREAHRLAPLVRRASLPEMRFASDALRALRALERGATLEGYTLILGAEVGEPDISPGGMRREQ